MPITGVAKKAGAAFADAGKVAAREGRRARAKKQKTQAPECFDGAFWGELCAGLEAHGLSGSRYLQTLAEVRGKLHGKGKDELLKASGIAKADIARAKREGRWMEAPDGNARRG